MHVRGHSSFIALPMNMSIPGCTRVSEVSPGLFCTKFLRIFRRTIVFRVQGSRFKVMGWVIAHFNLWGSSWLHNAKKFPLSLGQDDAPNAVCAFVDTIVTTVLSVLDPVRSASSWTMTWHASSVGAKVATVIVC